MKIRLTTLELCVSSFLCGIRTDLWPFYGFYCNRFDLSTIPIQIIVFSLNNVDADTSSLGYLCWNRRRRIFNPHSWRFRRERGGEIS